MIEDPVENHVLEVEVADKVSNLPESWSKWSSGWEFFKVIALEENVGLDRLQEPIELPIAFEERYNLQREIRVARLDGNTGQLFETVSQICDEIYRHGKRHCYLMFLADVLANSRTIYFIFYGNSSAELPNYLSDLQINGEGIRLRIENHHYAADLSHQMGQLERLTYKRAHGLELFAEGEGHGEPPNIDWAHDYLASSNFQKFRITNWAACPNYEVIKGPICVSVRRWGFPHSPAHPLFAPSRMHIDVTYKFYAGLPYFIKESTMEIIKDLRLITSVTMSGYFQDMLLLTQFGLIAMGNCMRAWCQVHIRMICGELVSSINKAVMRLLQFGENIGQKILRHSIIVVHRS